MKRLSETKRKNRKRLAEVKLRLSQLIHEGAHAWRYPSDLMFALNAAMNVAEKHLPDGDLVCDACGGRLIPGDPVRCHDCDYVEEGWDD